MTCWPRLAYKNKFWSQYIPWQFSNKWYWQNRYETCSDSLLNSIILCSWQVWVSFEAWKRQKIVQTPIQTFLLTTFQRTDNSVPKHQASYTGWIAFTGRFIIFLPWTSTDTTAQTIHTYISSWFTLPCSFIWCNDSSVSNGIDKIVMRHVQAAFALKPDWLSHYCRSLKDEYPW